MPRRMVGRPSRHAHHVHGAARRQRVRHIARRADGVGVHVAVAVEVLSISVNFIAIIQHGYGMMMWRRLNTDRYQSFETSKTMCWHMPMPSVSRAISGSEVLISCRKPQRSRTRI
jgi:hypothetical protein